LDRQHKETFRRALVAGVKLYKARNPETDYEQPEEYGKLPMWKELAYYFVRECIEDYQVPIEALDMKFICSVTATRGMGSGSPVGMDMATQNLLQLYPMLDERGKRNALAKRVAFVAGPENLHEFVTEYEAADVPTDHKWAATMENNGMRDPMADLLVTPLQDHVAHIERHFQFALKLLQGLQAGQIDPMQALMVLHVLGPHGKDHMNQLAGDPGRKAQLQAIEADWLQLSKIVDQLQQQVQEAQANQQPPKPQMDPEMVKVLGDLQLKRVKEQGNLQIKAETARAKSAIADSQAAHAMRLETLKALPTADIHPLGAAA
jgi:hypothetical protein